MINTNNLEVGDWLCRMEGSGVVPVRILKICDEHMVYVKKPNKDKVFYEISELSQIGLSRSVLKIIGFRGTVHLRKQRKMDCFVYDKLGKRVIYEATPMYKPWDINDVTVEGCNITTLDELQRCLRRHKCEVSLSRFIKRHFNHHLKKT